MGLHWVNSLNRTKLPGQANLLRPGNSRAKNPHAKLTEGRGKPRWLIPLVLAVSAASAEIPTETFASSPQLAGAEAVTAARDLVKLEKQNEKKLKFKVI